MNTIVITKTYMELTTRRLDDTSDRNVIEIDDWKVIDGDLYIYKTRSSIKREHVIAAGMWIEATVWEENE